MGSSETQVRISAETWKRLNERKRGPGDTFDDVLQRLIDENEAENPAD